jgi:hypothetical protein
VIVVSVGTACCILEHPVEEHFLHPRTRSSLALPVGENSAQRAVNFCSAVGATYNVPKYSAPFGDALKNASNVGKLKTETELYLSLYLRTIRIRILKFLKNPKQNSRDNQ